jgi:hypothetical protein
MTAEVHRLVTKKEFEDRLSKAEDLSIERIGAAKELAQERFAAALAAVDVAGKALEKRFDSVNEFRQTLIDQNITFVKSIEYNAQYKALSDKVDLLGKTNPAILIGGVSIIVAIVIALISGAIQLGSLQTHVQIDSMDVAKLKDDETNRIVEHAGENVERGNLQTRQSITEKEIDQIRSDERDKLPSLQALIERISKLEVELKNQK